MSLKSLKLSFCFAINIFFLYEFNACQSRINKNEWECFNRGSERRCMKKLDLPSNEKWDCYVSNSSSTCIGEGKIFPDKNWQCFHREKVTLCIFKEKVEPPEPSPSGWQCFSQGEKIVCDWRRYGNDRWNCNEKQCTEKLPDFPGPDEWECIEEKWGIICRGKFLREINPLWNCTEFKDRFLCLNLDPDYPPEISGNSDWKCRYDNSMKTGRLCTPVRGESTKKCPGHVFEGKCFPDYKYATCYFDFDCKNGEKCLLGKCEKM